MTETYKSKPIKATAPVKGKIARLVVKEAMSKPSQTSITRNMSALKLVERLRG